MLQNEPNHLENEIYPKLCCSLIFLAYGLVIVASCEKETAGTGLDGTLDFYLNCNKVLYRACLGPSNFNYKEVLIFNKNVITQTWGDSVIFSQNYSTEGDYLVIGSGGNSVLKEFDIQSDTLVIIDTCTTCDINTFIRR